MKKIEEGHQLVNISKAISRLLRIIAVFLIVACQSSETTKLVEEPTESSTRKFTKVRLEQVDSIMIDVIGNLEVYDYDAETGLFLAGDIARERMIYMGGGGPKFNELGHMVIDRNGEIVEQFNRSDKGPEGFGGKAADNFFLGGKSIGVLNAKGLHQYGLDGTFLKKYKGLNILDASVGVTFGGFIAGDDAGMLAMALPKWNNEEDSVNEVPKPLRFYNLKRFETGYEPVTDFTVKKYGYPDHHVFAPDSKFANGLSPKVSLNDITDELQVLYTEIPYLDIYDMSTGDLMKRMDLKPDHFRDLVEMGEVKGGTLGYEQLAWINKGGRFANSTYLLLIQLGEYTLTMYSTGLPSEELSRLINSPEKIGKNEEWPSTRRKHYKFYYQLFKDGEKVVPDFQLPVFDPQEGQAEFTQYNKTRGVLIGGDGLDKLYVYVPNDGDEERDYELIRVYKLQLTQE
ncbi:hypothetical protein [Roseivirga sp. E12]|uniref:hypothetical protein n=1 Tax=Roseivirga sp. E12 TaxID=2819237 RepID=UPI001ABCCBCC|nr:hypothetical protein [Roseivirga sp. E12]MBO3696984.1 hypothetical protein [Roseivirga sp. E12]